MCIHCRQTTQLSAATAAVFMVFMSLTFLLHLQFPNIISAKYVSNANEFPSISRCKSGTRWLKLHWGKQRKTNRDRGKEIKMNSVVVLLFLGTSFFSRSKFSIWIVSNAKKKQPKHTAIIIADLYPHTQWDSLWRLRFSLAFTLHCNAGGWTKMKSKTVVVWAVARNYFGWIRERITEKFSPLAEWMIKVNLV